jgi:hypothetical protein
MRQYGTVPAATHLDRGEAHHLQLAKLVNAETDSTEEYFILTNEWEEKKRERAGQTRNESPTNAGTWQCLNDAINAHGWLRIDPQAQAAMLQCTKRPEELGGSDLIGVSLGVPLIVAESPDDQTLFLVPSLSLM